MYHLAKSLYLYATSKEEYSILLLGLDNAGKTTLLNQIKTLFDVHQHHSTTTSLPAPSTMAGNTVPTVGQNIATVDLPEMYLRIWDVGGQQSLRRLWTSYYKSAHAVVFVVDSSDLGTGTLEYDDDYITAGAGAVSSSGGADAAGAAATVGVGGRGRRSSSTVVPKTPITPITPGLVQHNAERYGRLDECRAALESVLGHEDMVGVPILVLANKQDREDCVEVVRIKEGFVRKVFEGERGGMIRDSRVLPVSALKGTGVREAVDWVKSRVRWNKEGRPPVMR